MISYIDTIHLKMISIEGKCMKEMYDDERSQVLEYISSSLDSRIATERRKLAAIKTELKELDRLPRELVREYSDTQDKINNCKDYFARLDITN